MAGPSPESSPPDLASPRSAESVLGGCMQLAEEEPPLANEALPLEKDALLSLPEGVAMPTCMPTCIWARAMSIGLDMTHAAAEATPPCNGPLRAPQSFSDALWPRSAEASRCCRPSIPPWLALMD